MAQLTGTKPVAMPSRVVDDLWHAHITCTRASAASCAKAFGTFLHHRPEAEMTPDRVASNGGPDLRRTYELAVGLEGPRELPLLFRLDGELGIEGGRRFVRSCGRARCAGGPATCLQHLPAHLPRQRRDGRGDGWADSGWGGGERDSAWSGGAGDGGDGGGCGGGGD